MAEDDPFAAEAEALVASSRAAVESAEAIPAGEGPSVEDLSSIVLTERTERRASGATAHYDEAQRTLANDQGSPIVRMHATGLIPDNGLLDVGVRQFVFIWRRRNADRTFVYASRENPVPRQLSMKILDQMIERRVRIVVPDAETVRALPRLWSSIRKVSHPDYQVAARLNRQVSLMVNLSWSAFMIVLTRSLARKYWLPITMDEERLIAWLTAFGISLDQKVSVDLLAQVLELLVPGEEHTTPMNGIFRAEASALGSRHFNGLRADVSSFNAASRAEGHAKAIALADRGLLERNITSGDVCAVTVTGVDELGFTATLSTPFQMKVLSDLTMLSPEPGGRNTAVFIEQVTVSGDTLFATIRAGAAGKPAKGTRGVPRSVALATEAMRSGGRVYLIEKGFSGGGGGPEHTGRWSARKLVGDRPRSRKLPTSLAKAL